MSFFRCIVGVLLAMLSLTAAAPGGMTRGDAKLAASMPLAPAAAGGWSIVPSRSVSGAQYNLLNGVTCASASDCWAVGYYADTSFHTLIEHWDGTSWAIVTSPNSSATQFNFLNSVSCVSASDCWAVGYYQSGLLSTQTLIEHWDGTSWAIVTSPDATATRQNYLNSVSCVSASNCWAVGYYEAASSISNAYQTLIERWDGTSWVIVSSPDSLSNQDNILFGVTCSSASDCWSVGHSRIAIASQTLIKRWDGTPWARVTSPSTSPTQNNYLLGVACASASDCSAVGYYDAGSVIVGPRYQTLIERRDGTSWAIVNSANTSDTQDNFLNGVTCVPGSDCWAVGYYVAADDVPRTLTLKRGGPTAVTLRSFTATRSRGEVLLRWRTASGAGNLGFNLYRAKPGSRVKLNERLIPSPVSARARGHSYVWRDRSPGRSARYWLEAVKTDGSRAWLGSATVR